MLFEFKILFDISKENSAKPNSIMERASPQIYCRRCKTKTDSSDESISPPSEAGRRLHRGVCAVCNCGKCRFAGASDELPVVQGDGLKDILKEAKRRLAGVKQAFVGIRQNYSPVYRKHLERVGDYVITDAELMRTPISAGFEKALRTVKKIPYDKLFHLAIILTVQPKSGGRKQRFTYDKTELNRFFPYTPSQSTSETETRKLDLLRKDLTVNELLTKTEKGYGTENYFTYDARNRNCQDFILATLQYNKDVFAENAENTAFVKQDVEDLIPAFVGKVAKIGTDLKSKLDLIIKGLGIEE